jgi:hypothetical protein
MPKTAKREALLTKDPFRTDSKKALIEEIANEKINSIVLEELARNLNRPFPKGKNIELYNKLDDVMLDFINRIFVKKESDGKGLFLEYRTANFIKQEFKQKIKRIEIRHKFSGDEIDVTGFNTKGKPVVIAECKDKHAKKEDISKWITNSKKLFHDYKGSLEESYFVTSNKLTGPNYTYIETFPEINSEEGVLKVHGLLRGLFKNLSDDKTVTGSRGIALNVYEVRQNEFVKIFPKK